MEPPSRPYSHHDDARRLTGDLRTSDEPRWAAVRQHLIESGFDPQRSAVGDLFPEDIGDFGVLVASDRTTHTFEVGTEPIRRERGKYRIWVTHEERTSARSRYAYGQCGGVFDSPASRMGIDAVEWYMRKTGRWKPRKPFLVGRLVLVAI